MRDWVALDEFLSKFSSTLDTSYGLDPVVLDSICDLVQLERSTVHGLIVWFGKPDEMSFSQIVTILYAGEVGQ
jgi:hypothetical protein